MEGQPKCGEVFAVNCREQHVFISHAFGQGGGKEKRELSAVWRE